MCIVIVNIVKKIHAILFLSLTRLFSNKYLAKLVIGARGNRISNNLHNLVRHFSGNNEVADALVKKIIKSIIKFGVLYNNRNTIFSQNDLKLVMDFREQCQEIIELYAELHNSNFVLHRLLLKSKYKDCQNLIHRIIGNRLTRKRHERIDFVFNYISNQEFIKYAFDSKSAFNHAIIKEIIVDLRALGHD
jgi:hypothetical protein